MPKKNILVTGANGFIGKALVNGLDRNQFNVFALDNENRREPNDLPVEKFYLQDITVPFKLDVPFDHVLHLAALNVTHVDAAEYQEYHRVNVRGTENLIKTVHSKNFAFMSTVKVYRRQDGLIDEHSPVKPEGDYARSKLEAEELCRRLFREEGLTVFRAVNVAGPGQPEKAVIPIFFKRALRNEPLEILYPVDTILQVLDIGDLLRAFYLLAGKDRGVGTVNLSSGETITLGDLAKEIIAICRSKSPLHTVPDKKVAAMKVISTKAKSTLGWAARTPIRDIIRNYYNFVAVPQ